MLLEAMLASNAHAPKPEAVAMAIAVYASGSDTDLQSNNVKKRQAQLVPHCTLT